ncbi:MAG TPA: DUF6470 family protein [Bacilli bacterium]
MNTIRLSIHQVFAAIGIHSTRGEQQIRSRHGELIIRQEPAEIKMETSGGELEINADAAWAAYGKQPHLQWRNMVYSQMPRVFLQALAKIVDDGNRMADIASRRNAIADIAQEAWQHEFPQIEYVGAASYDNVEVSIAKKEISISVKPNFPQIEYRMHKPEIQFRRGGVEIYMRQKNSITITTAPYDLFA